MSTCLSNSAEVLEQCYLPYTIKKKYINYKKRGKKHGIVETGSHRFYEQWQHLYHLKRTEHGSYSTTEWRRTLMHKEWHSICFQFKHEYSR